MPEGDTVYLAARRLHDALAGRELTRSDFRVPQLATTDLTGRQVLEVVSRGKHLLTRIAGGLTLHTHFRMDGTWHLYRPGVRWTGGPAYQVRVVLENADWQAVGYRLPVVELLATDQEHTAVGHLGPDLLGPDWDIDEAVRRLRADPDREIAPALLDQRNLAGIGNLYKTEALYLSGVTPWTKVADVDVEAVVRRAHRLMVANKDHWQQTTTGSTRRGEDHWVFERAGRPCRRCGARIVEALQSEREQSERGQPERGQPERGQPEPGRELVARISYWCPTCQAGPAPRPGTGITGRAAPGRAGRAADRPR